MIKAICLNKKTGFNDLADIQRVYIGVDNCENMLSYQNTAELIKYYSACGKRITLLLPFLSDKSFSKVSKIIDCLYKTNNDSPEIVFNDWGTFYFLTKNYKDFALVMGRLLVKQKKDPRAEIILNNKQDKFKLEFARNTKNYNYVYKKDIPESLSELFSGNCVETGLMHSFLKDNNVSRIELDNLLWKMSSKLPKTIKASLYYPYALVSLTRYCGALYDKYRKVCNFDCANIPVTLNNDFYLKGNAVYCKNDKMLSKAQIRRNNIDRLVLFDIFS